MNSTIPSLPTLRQGKYYTSLDQTGLHDLRSGELVAKVNTVNAGIIRRDMKRYNKDCLKHLTSAELIRICNHAGDLFLNGTLPVGENDTQTPDDFKRQLAATSGLPYTLINRNMMKIYQVFTEMPSILAGLTRGLDLEIFDTGYGEQAGIPVSFYSVANALGVVLPSNSPGVNSLWIPAIALKIPVVLKPGKDEPWTPLRIIQAFIAAGCPREAFSYYPTDHEGSNAVMESCDRALIFGDVGTVAKFAGNPGVQVHGPGWSKVIIGEDCVDDWGQYVDVIVRSISDNGGRSCINASSIIVPRHAKEIAEAVAEKLAKIVPLATDDPEALLSGFANPKMAEYIEASIVEGLKDNGAEDITAKYRTGDRSVLREGSSYLLPTLVFCEKHDHPLADKEFLFPYASLLEMKQSELIDKFFVFSNGCHDQ